MATTTYTDRATSPFAPMAALLIDATATALDGLRSLEIKPFKVLSQWQARQERRAHLADLDARLIADMGLTQAAVDAEAGKPFWKA